MMWFAVKISDAVLLKQFSGIVIIRLVIQTNRTKNSGMSKFATQVFHYIGTFSFQLMIRIPRVTIHAGDGLLGAVIWLLLKGKSWFCSYLVMVVKCNLYWWPVIHWSMRRGLEGPVMKFVRRGVGEREKGLKGRESRKTGKFRAVENNTNIQLAKFSLKANIEKWSLCVLQNKVRKSYFY